MCQFTWLTWFTVTFYKCSCWKHRAKPVAVGAQSSLKCIQSFPSLLRLTDSHLLALQFALKRVLSSEANSNISFSFFSFNGDVLHDLFKWQTSPVSLFLSRGISHWVLMSDYFTSHSALDKWLRQAVKNRSKPLGWERGGGGGRRLLNHPHPLRHHPTGHRKCHPLFVCSG